VTTLIFFLVFGFVVVMVLALCRNAKTLDEKEFREFERELHLKHFEDINRKKAS
jgi:hypothetical protein